MSSYDRELVESLIPAVWDSNFAWGMANEREAPADMPKAPSPKNATHTLWAHLADIRRAWHGADLTFPEMRALVLMGGMGMTSAEAARTLGVTRKPVTEAYDRGVSKLLDFLNGTTLSQPESWAA